MIEAPFAIVWAGDLLGSATAQGLWIAGIWFALASALVGAFDISLPRGDTVGVTGALDVVALVVLGPMQAFAVAVVGAFVSYALRLRAARPTRLGVALGARIGGLSVAALVIRQLFNTMDALPWGGWLAASAGIAVYLVSELAVFQAVTAARGGRSITHAIRGNFQRQMPLLLAQASAAMLAGIVFPTVGPWSLILVVALLLLIRQSYALLLEIRETYRTTVAVLVDAAEEHGSESHGHAERAAQIARDIAVRCGLSPAEVERVSYAALLHDIGDIGQGNRHDGSRGFSARVIEEVEFFQDIIGIVRLCDGVTASEGRATEVDMLEAYIVALASDIDVLRAGVEGPAFRSHAGRLAASVPAALKAKAVGAAVHLGYGTPAL